MNRENIKQFIESKSVQNFIIGLIILNSITIGFETSDKVMSSMGDMLFLIDKIILAIFVLEITLSYMLMGSASLEAAGMFLISLL